MIAMIDKNARWFVVHTNGEYRVTDTIFNPDSLCVVSGPMTKEEAEHEAKLWNGGVR